MAVSGQKYHIFYRPLGGRVRSMVATFVEHQQRGGGTYVFNGGANFGNVNIPEDEFISLGFTREAVSTARELQDGEDQTRVSR